LQENTQVSGCLRIAIPLLVLLATTIYCSFPHPTHDQAELKALAAEARQLMAAHPLTYSRRYGDLSEDSWPPAVKKVGARYVIVRPGMVDITTKPFFDGGWGYGFAPDKRSLPMLAKCWSALGHGLYWHGPC